MKRAMYRNVMMAGAAAFVVTACTPGSEGPTASPQTDVPSSDWNQTPVIESVQVTGREIRLSGSAQAGARVVLRSTEGAAYAAVANKDGRFDVAMQAPTRDLWLKPETQVGQNAATSPDTLLIPAGGQGPIAVLRAGGPTRRLDRAPALGAVDSDGQARRLAGRVASGIQTLPLRVGALSVQAFPDATGYWTVVLGPETSGNEIVVGDEVFVWPGRAAMTVGRAPQRERAGEGWRVVWTEAGAAQTTWLPDAR